MKKNKTYIIAEVGTNHNGSLQTALKYVDKLAISGVDAIKFQIGDFNEVYSNKLFAPVYQKKLLKKSNYTDVVKARLLSYEDHKKIFERCKKKNLDYLCSAFDLKSLKFITKNMRLKYYKIPSSEIYSIDILKFISKKKKKIILSTGMSNMKDISACIKELNKNFKKDSTILHCVSDYPVSLNKINMNFMPNLKKIFKYDIGYSDHSNLILPCVVAVAMGAKIIEKHVTFDTKSHGADHKASISVKDFTEMVRQIREIEKILGSDKKVMTAGEISNLRSARKSIVINKNLNRGHILGYKDLSFKKPGIGINPMHYKKILNKKLNKKINKDSILRINDIYLKK